MFVEHKERGEVTEAPARTMKLSEAMRIGARLRPRCVGVFGDAFMGGSCAIGAAGEAVYGTRPWDLDLKQINFVMRELPLGMDKEIFRRNDTGEPRESIADWLESQGF